jgi:Ser/Thr protein kinase RdoA (MazF antagonist)
MSRTSMRGASSASHRHVTTAAQRGPVTVSSPVDPATIPAGWPPALHLLLGPAAGDLWAAVLGPLGGTPTALRPIGVGLQADGAATAQYSADVAWTDGRATREVLAATTGSRIPPGAAVLTGKADGAEVTVGVWRWPLDPALPALRWAASAAGVGERLAALGLVRAAAPARLRLRGYRPGRRAVVEARTPEGRFFLKVVRPAAAGRLAGRHELLAGHVPVPPVLARTEDGAVVLPGLPGTSLRSLLSGDGTGLPGAPALDAVLDALPADLHRRPGRTAPGHALARVDAHASVVAATMPELAPRVAALTDRLAGADRGEHPVVPVHGDFYESQLLVDGGAVVGLLDVDTAGAGARIDDWATLLAHLAVQAQVQPHPRTTTRWTAQLLATADRRWPRAQLDARVAAAVVGLATGPFRVQQRDWRARTEQRLALAEDWATGRR